MINRKEYSQLVLITLGLLGLFLLLAYLLKSAMEVMLLIFAGILFAIFIRGLSGFLFSRLKIIPEQLRIVITLLLLISAFTAFVIFLAPQLTEQGQKLVKELPAAVENIREKIGSLNWLENLLQSGDDSDPLAAAGEVTGKFFGVFATGFGGLTGMFIILFIGLYLCFTPETYLTGMLRLLPGNWRKRGREVFQALDHILGRWIISRFIGMLVVTLFTFLGLLYFEVPLPLGLAVLAGLLTFIPNIGPVIAAIPAVLLGYMQSSTTGLYVILLYVLIQAVESYLITPLIQQRGVSLPPVITLTSQVLLASLFGFLGLLLATPLAAAALVLVKMLYLEEVFHEQTDIEGVE